MKPFRQANLETQLLLNREYAKRMLEASQRSGRPDLYLTVIEGIQFEIASILDELEIYEQPRKAGGNDVGGDPEGAAATGLMRDTRAYIRESIRSDHATV